MLSKLFRRTGHLGPGAIRRVMNVPLLVTPDVARIYAAHLMAKHGYDGRFHMWDDDGEYVETVNDVFAANLRGAKRTDKSFHQDRGIAVLPIDGTLAHKYGSLDPESGMTGYDGLEAKLADAIADPTVQGILLDIDSPGGEVAGCFQLADMILAGRDIKPVWAMVDEMACSAAYAIAASCSRVYMTDTADVGSIGVVMMHADFSKALAKDGVDVTFIHAGAHKVDGNPYAPLPDAVRASWQAQLETLRGRFADAVAKGRGISADVALGTEARVIQAPEAVSLGLVDGIMPPQSAVQAFLDDLSGTKSAPRSTVSRTAAASASAASPQTEQEPEMDPKTPGAAATAAAAPVDVATIEADATRKANERIATILSAPEAKGREALAQSLATTTTLTSEQVIVQLKAAPLAVKSHLAAAMQGQDPKVATDLLPQVGTVDHSKDLNAAAIYARRAEETRAAGRR